MESSYYLLCPFIALKTHSCQLINPSRQMLHKWKMTCKPACVHFCGRIFVCINVISYDMYHKKGHGASSMNGAILDISLISQVIGWFDWHFHSLHCEKRSQICCVWGDYYESECPPKRERQREQGHKRWKQRAKSKEPIAVLCNVSIDLKWPSTHMELQHTLTLTRPHWRSVWRGPGAWSLTPAAWSPPQETTGCFLVCTDFPAGLCAHADTGEGYTIHTDSTWQIHRERFREKSCIKYLFPHYTTQINHYILLD